MIEMSENKLEKNNIRKQGNRVALVVLGNQLVFQFGTLIMILLFAFALSLFGMTKEMVQNINPLLSSDVMQLVAGIVFLVFYLRNKKHIQPMERRCGTPKMFGLGLLVVLGANMIISAIEIVVRYVGDITLMPTSEVVVNKNNLLILIILGAIFPAIVEELIYRCVLYRVLRACGIIYATVVSSIIFGLVHMNFIQIPFAFCLGCVSCILYEKTGRIRYSMLIHFINNSIMFFVSAMPIDMKLVDYVQAFIGIACFVLTCIWIIANRMKIKNYIDYAKEETNKIVWNITSGGMVLLTVICVTMSAFIINA